MKRVEPPAPAGVFRSAATAWCWLVLAAALALLAACGGGTQVAGVGSGGTGLAEGTISGFGSVIVDGIEYDDTGARAQTEDASGAQRNAELKLGQRVRITYSGDNDAQLIQVLPQMAGPVGAALDADGWLLLAGQWVRVVAGNDDYTRSAPTVLDGYAAASAIAAGDEVQAFGSWVFDARKSAYVLVATRLEKLAAAGDPVQLGGVVQALAGNTFRLNAPGGTQVLAADASALSAGQVVTVWVPRSALAVSPVTATRVAAGSLVAQDVGAGAPSRIGGLATQFDAAARTVVVQGATVQLAPDCNVDEAALARGEFVSLQITRSGSTLVAGTAQLRDMRDGDGGDRGGARDGGRSDFGKTNDLKGVTSGVNWAAQTVSFSLRGVDVRADASVIDASCRAAAGGSVYVQASGRAAAPGLPVTASRVQCSASPPADATVQKAGTVASVDTAARILVLVTDQGSFSARWDTRTFFQQGAASLTGQRVQVEAVQAGSGASALLMLRKVLLAN